jgi:hypothetical protein
MIKIDKTELTTEGNINSLISEAGAMMHYLTKKLTEYSNLEQTDVYNKIKNVSDVYALTETGMTTAEAVNVIMPDEVRGITEVFPDGTTNKISLEKETQ